MNRGVMQRKNDNEKNRQIITDGQTPHKLAEYAVNDHDYSCSPLTHCPKRINYIGSS